MVFQTPCLCSCSHKEVFPYSFFIKQTIQHTKTEIDSQIDIANELVESETGEDYFSEAKTILDFVLDEIASKCEDVLCNKDPVDILQDQLILNKDLVIENTKKILNETRIKELLTEKQRDYVLSYIKNICNNLLNFKDSIKRAWTLKNIFNYFLVPYCDDSKEDAWKLIYKIWDDKYYTGINHSHLDGSELKTPIDQICVSENTTYKLYDWENVQPGDLFFSEIGFEDKGQNIGHLAIIEGKYKDPNNREYYRTIECNQYGISYGLVDDIRMSSAENKGHIFRINNMSQKQINKVLSFARHEVDKKSGYSCPIMLTMSTSYQPSWYCSEFIWAAYKSAGIDLNQYSYDPNTPIITPYDIWDYKDKTIILDYLN